MSDAKRTADTSGGMAFERPIRDIEAQLEELEELSKGTELDITSEVDALRQKLTTAIESTYKDLSPWDGVSVARHPERPVAGDYIAHLFEDFMELHGDRVFGDDPAMVAGFARLAGRPLMLVGHRKGRTTKERLRTNFGCAHPEGYRKALRKMQLAEKLEMPIVTLINTPGAYPGIGAEERGQAAAIAENILAMFKIKTPIVTLVIGEGGSGGALGIGVGDRVLMLQHSYYSVISPEGCAAILWKDGSRTPDAASSLKLTGPDLSELGLVDEVIPEPLGGAHREPEVAYQRVEEALARHLDELMRLSSEELLAARREKYRRMASLEDRFPVI